MFGGNILSTNIETLNYKNRLLAVFNNQLYIFNLNEIQILHKYQLSQNLIKAWKYSENLNQIIAFDDQGYYIQATFNKPIQNKQNWFDNLQIKNKKITKNIIHHAQIFHNNQFQNQFKSFFVQQNYLYQYQNGSKTLLNKNFKDILLVSNQFTIGHYVGSMNKLNIISFSSENKNKETLFEHTCQIISVAVNQDSLIIGDIKGKIYYLKNYFISQNPLIKKLEWHVHKVNCLYLDQQYLYSAGQEGTVVMWHLRQEKKDFLPRIGTQILNLFVSEGIVYSILKDNSINAIDLSNDKIIKQYKTVINPLGFDTKQIKNQGVNGKKNFIKYSQNNNRNLMIASSLPGSLQLINLNDGNNTQIQLLPRNLISRLDEYYPEPHDVNDVSFNQDWTLMCCSTYGIHHNYLHFYKNQGYNLQYSLISKVQNPHKGKINILSYNNTFITYSQNQKILRFWSKIRKAKKSIIQKQQQYFVCSGQINYRQKQIKNCCILEQQNMLLINYKDEIVLIDLKIKQIYLVFKSNKIINKGIIIKTSKKQKNIILITNNKILAYQLNQKTISLQNIHTIYNFQNLLLNDISFDKSTNGKIIIVIKYQTKQCIIEYDLNKYSIIQSFTNQNIQNGSILAICYMKNKILCFGSDSSIANLTNKDQFVKFNQNRKYQLNSMQTQQDSTFHFQNQTFQYIQNNYIQRRNTKQKNQVYQCLQKIQLEMYPNTAFAFNALCHKVFF